MEIETANRSKGMLTKRYRHFPITVIQAISVRLIYLIHNILAISRAAHIANNDLYWIYMLIYIAFLAEGCFVVFRRKGIEFKWYVDWMSNEMKIMYMYLKRVSLSSNFGEGI